MTQSSRPTKSALVREMLASRQGATLAKLCEATGWQRHTTRAALSGLRKAGYTIERKAPAKAGGEMVYRITATPEAGA